MAWRNLSNHQQYTTFIVENWGNISDIMRSYTNEPQNKRPCTKIYILDHGTVVRHCPPCQVYLIHTTFRELALLPTNDCDYNDKCFTAYFAILVATVKIENGTFRLLIHVLQTVGKCSI